MRETVNMSADTWGISGPYFLSWYVVAGIVIVTLSAGFRTAVVRSWVPRPGPPLSPTELGMLVSERRAVTTALAWLRATDAIDRRGVTAHGLRERTDSLTAEVYDRISAGCSIEVLSLMNATDDALARMRGDLVERKFIVGPDYRRAVRWCAAPIAVLVFVGVVRFCYGVANRKPVGYLAVLIVLFMLACWLVFSTSWRFGMWTAMTPLSGRMLNDIRKSNDHLDPRHRPSYATYGPMSAAMSVALLGPAALLLLDPELGADLGFAAAVGSAGGSGGSCGGAGGGTGGCGGGGGGCGG